jgi:mono/diheme cytochrome c family protein
VKRVILAALFWAATMGGAAADGAQVFDNSCAFCHQEGGVGVAGQFPRLSGRVGVIASQPQGKALLPKILLNGMSGRITVDGQAILGIMPAFDSLSDEDIASVLSYLSGLEHAPVEFGADEIKQARAQPRLSPTEVAAQRDQLSAAKIVP